METDLAGQPDNPAATAEEQKLKGMEGLEQRQEKEQAPKKRRRIHPDVWKALEIGLSLGILVVIVIQAVTYKKQSDLMSEAIRQSVITRELENRPWVHAESADFTKPMELKPQAELSLSVTVAMKNFGTSAATDAMTFIYAVPNASFELSRNWNEPCGRVEDQRAILKKNNSWPVGIVLAPQQIIKLPLLIYPQNITAEQLRTGDFLILGCATYGDQYHLWHQTQFCFKPIVGQADSSKVTFERCYGFEQTQELGRRIVMNQASPSKIRTLGQLRLPHSSLGVPRGCPLKNPLDSDV